MQAELNEQHRSWLHKRGITDKVIAAFSIHTKDVPALKLQNAITIPVRNIDGTHSFNKYRRDPMEGNVKPKYLYDRGSKITLYGADNLVAASPTAPFVVITEGELDALVCWSANIPAVSSTGGATSFQDEWVELLGGRATGEAGKRVGGYEVYVCFDNDEAGHKGVIRVLDVLPNAKVMFVPTNVPGVKDISDYVAHGGSIHELMKTARTYLSVEEVEEEMRILSATWSDYRFHELFIEHRRPALPTNTGSAKPRSDSDDRLVRAKSVDCRSLLPFTKVGKYPRTQCLWHNDHDPSLTYYARNNTCYCHVCGKYADAVDIVMATDGVTLKTAIKKLLNE